MNPAEELRAAATLLRETAKTGPWLWTVDPGKTQVYDRVGGAPFGAFVADCRNPAVAAWIALASPALAEPLADLIDSIAAVHEQPPCDAPEACNRCAEPDPVIIDALRVVLELTGSTS